METLQSPSSAVVAEGKLLDTWKNRCGRISEFAAFLGSDKGVSKRSSSSTTRTKSILEMLSDSKADHEVVLTLPSLDLGLSEKDSQGNNPLPDIGGHFEGSQDQSRPSMAASVLTHATEGAANSEWMAAQNIGKLTSWTRSTMQYASDAMRKNTSNSFSSLVDARVRAWTLLLLRHSLSTGNNESRTSLMNILSSSIKVASTDIKFQPLPFPESAAQASNDIVLPLLFEVVLRLTVQDNEESAIIRAPGTIHAHFRGDSSDPLAIVNVVVKLDSAKLLNSMIEQARRVVLKSVASATKTNVPHEALSTVSAVSMGTILEDRPSDDPAVNPGTSLASFRNSLNLSSRAEGNPPARDNEEESPRLQKARSSALRLNSVLHHQPTNDTGSGSLGIRKVRSVRWDTPSLPPKLSGSLAPSPKKPRNDTNAAKLKSFKSFGRAHAEDFGSGPRNATFAEFERAGVWGRNGRLAHHPQPQQPGREQFIGTSHTAGGNATFDLGATVRRGIGRPGEISNNLGSGQSRDLPRTTTALEMFLLHKSTGSGKA